jgi:hypothetical protein
MPKPVKVPSRSSWKSSRREHRLEYTFGIIGKGPGFVGFVIPLVPQHQDGSLSCPGRVVRRKETVNRLDTLAKRERVTIASVDIVSASSSSSSSSSSLSSSSSPKEEL